MAQQTRSIWGTVLRNFIDSLKPRQFRATLIGTDYFGNKYYEIPPNKNGPKRRPVRWFEPAVKDDFESERPGEWDSWLRGRRKEPPTEEELQQNLAIMQMKKHNAIAVEAKAGQKTPMKKGIETFPKHPDLEIVPGKGPQNGN